MNTNKSIDIVLKTLNELHRDLSTAQRGPMEPLLRSELSRLAGTTAHIATQLLTANQSALGQIAAKKEAIATLAAANKAAIAKQQAAAQQKPETLPAEPASPPIDPTLGHRLAAELLGRQAKEPSITPPKQSQGVLDGWDWRNSKLPILQ
ncbi:hypothetical protein [Botrimarina mediterranea]|uniref:Uncharacterized protein n=1 Tax=Botrimarina mediterranea TaxID=2528022 RepID=A0A518K897_9BACT|nr:hypothetical protein [Botrimarina mediterranea]QDV74018.1 hypothetical protein Spa11_22170 [Botrimarina mediterranea]QDV78648.1 hypothetical protein K2D_22550 [Planctomycetes bacterium K2D]